MDWRLRLPSALYRLAVERAGSDAALADVVRGYLERYVGPSQQANAARARAASLTPERRSEIARLAARARHAHEPTTKPG